MSSMQISVAILTANRLEKLKRCIAAVQQQLAPGDEIVVYDTGSTDGTREWLLWQTSGLRYLFGTGKCDFAMARNSVADNCNGDIIAFIDDDCYADAYWVDRIRRKMQNLDALGGVVMLADRSKLPTWWNEEFAWTVGMSSKGVFEGRDDSYPATANLAIRRSVLKQYPFQQTGRSFADGNVYLSGREDAHWWLKARRSGLRVALDTKLIVWHDVEASRFTLRSVLSRALIDGSTAWERERNEDWATDACYCVCNGILRLPRYLISFHRYLPEIVWNVRQYGLVRKSGKWTFPIIAKTFRRVILMKLKKLASSMLSKYMRLRRRAFQIPKHPGTVLIVAPAYLGDTVLLQASISQLAHNLPSTRIEVITRYRDLFEACPWNVMALPIDVFDDFEVLRQAADRADVIFVPYWHNVAAEPWRILFCNKGITFSEDVGFPRRFDYSLARKLVPKRFTRNEAINLSVLFHQWPARCPLYPPVIVPDVDLCNKLLKEYPTLGGYRHFAMLQVDTAQTMKNWPAERWGVLCDVLLRFGLNVGIVNAEAHSDAAVMIQVKYGADRVADLGGCSIRELIALISGAAIAVGGCSGPKHLAFALRVPTFTVYGPMKPDRWGALGDESIHGYVVSPVPYLTSHEMSGLPPNEHMLLVDAQDAAVALEKHLNSLHWEDA